MKVSRLAPELRRSAHRAAVLAGVVTLLLALLAGGAIAAQSCGEPCTGCESGQCETGREGEGQCSESPLEAHHCCTTCCVSHAPLALRAAPRIVVPAVLGDVRAPEVLQPSPRSTETPYRPPRS